MQSARALNVAATLLERWLERQWLLRDVHLYQLQSARRWHVHVAIAVRHFSINFDTYLVAIAATVSDIVGVLHFYAVISMTMLTKLLTKRTDLKSTPAKAGELFVAVRRFLLREHLPEEHAPGPLAVRSLCGFCLRAHAKSVPMPHLQSDLIALIAEHQTHAFAFSDRA